MMPERATHIHNKTRCIMNKALLTLSALLLLLPAFSKTVDIYNFKMNLKVPRIYNNMQSLGYRKYQSQTLRGELHITYGDDGTTKVNVYGLYNKTHKVNGINVTYVCSEWPYDDDNVLIVGVGNNKTGKFTEGGASFSFVADPSYNIGKVDEDNTLMLELSGIGKIKNGILKNLKGSVRGQIGCGCKAYGHVSPTRLWFGFLTDIVVDVAPLYGTFTATFKGRSRK